MMYELLLPALSFLSVMFIGGALLTAHITRRQRVLVRLHENRDGYSASGSGEDAPAWLRGLHRFGRWLSGNKPSAGLQASLAMAGYHSTHAPLVYIGAKVLLLIVGLAGLAIPVLPLMAIPVLPVLAIPLPVRLLIILWGAGFLFLVPNIVVRMRRNKRRREILLALADAIDLLEISVSAGMGLDAAWNSVADQVRPSSSILADELALTNLEIHLGAPRKEALKHMAARTGAHEISSLVGVLVQSERFGTSVSEALRTFANSMREVRSQRAEEAAEKMPVKLIFPLALLLFPAVLIVVAGPAAVKWVEIISSS